jgi:hypothetical protein
MVVAIVAIVILVLAALFILPGLMGGGSNTTHLYLLLPSNYLVPLLSKAPLPGALLT